MSDNIPKTICCFVGILGICLFASLVSADDWPMLGRDSTRNPVSPEHSSPVEWNLGADWGKKNWDIKQAKNIKWVAPLGSISCGDPVVADGLIWVGTNNSTFDEEHDASVLACFRESDGKLLYKYVSPRLPIIMMDWPNSSMACSPLIEGDRLWFTTNRWEAICLDIGPLKRGTGEPQISWKCDMIKELGVRPNRAVMNFTRYSSFAMWEDRVYLLTGNGVDLKNQATVPAPDAPSLVCFHKKTGDVIWTDNSPGANLLSGQWSSPLVVNIEDQIQVIAPQGDGWIRAFDAFTGKPIWQFDMNKKSSLWIRDGIGTRNNILATPVLYKNRIYVASGQQASYGDGPGRLCCIDPSRSGDISSELAVDTDNKPLPHRRIQAIDTNKGEKSITNPNSGLIWDYTAKDLNGNSKIEFEEEFQRTFCSVAIKHDLLIAADYGGLVHCFNAKTGEHYWAYEMFIRFGQLH